MVKKFSFNATGRQLFAAEKVMVEVLNSKYKVRLDVVTDNVVRDTMESVRQAAQNSYRSGGPRTTVFFEKVKAKTADIDARRAARGRKAMEAQTLGSVDVSA